MNNEQIIRDSFTVQAGWCEKLGSPFTALLLAGLANWLDRSTRTGRKILNWRGVPDATGDAVALRLAGALHGLARAKKLPALAELYPPNALPERDELCNEATNAIAQADAEICAWLDFAPQTNEVARAAVLYAGLRMIAGETGLAISMFETGVSAGLNLMMDQFSYRFGESQFGQLNSGVVLSPEWVGSTPAGREPSIVSRRGCDINPLDVTNPEHRARLMAYVWPDQFERLTRVEAAIEIARRSPPRLDKADAGDWVEAMIGPSPLAGDFGVTRVLFHSIAFQYFPSNVKARIAARMAAAGALATIDTPLAWLAFEQVEGLGPTLTLRLWRGSVEDGETQILAKSSNAHVHDVMWMATERVR